MSTSTDDRLTHWTGHVAVITRGENHFEATDEDDGQEDWSIEIDCTQPESCEGWITCVDEGHPDPVSFGSEEAVVDGILHTWRGPDHGWTIPASGCVVQMSQDWSNGIDEAAFDLGHAVGAGSYRVDVDWNEFGPVISLFSNDPELYGVTR